MNLRNFYLSALFLLLLTAFSRVYATGRQSVSFNSGWFFYKGDTSGAHLGHAPFAHWTSVLLPHTWNDKDVLADDERGYYRGIGWYKRRFSLNAEPGKRYFLRFEGVNQVCEVYVNGKKAANHIGGYTAFNVDITPYLNSSSQQTIAVKVDNSLNEDIPPLTADFTFFGGIYRPVQLITTGSQTFSMNDDGGPGVYISTPKVNEKSADINITYRLSNYSSQATKVVIESKLAGNAVSELLFKRSTPVVLKPGSDTSVSISVHGVSGYKLWSTDTPNLYYLESSLTINGVQSDHIAQPMGFRWFRFDADSGFYLNGKQVKLMGANRHQDRMPYGNALSYDMHRQDMDLLKDMGGNFLRTAHYPQAKEVLDLADGLGILVWEEIPLVNEVTRNAAYPENAHRMLREMIKQYYNHPSVIIWAYMNEIYWAHRFKPAEELPSRNEFTIQLAKSLDKECRKLDPYRYTAMAMHNYPAYEETGLGSIPMIAGWNLYHGWYYDKYEDFGKFMDEQKAKHPERVHIISEYGAGAHTGIYSSQPEKFDFSMEGQIALTRSFIKQIMARPYIAGASIWNLADFSSESRVDASPHINNKGLVTADRKPKDAYFLTRALLSKKPVTTIGYPFRSKWVYAAQSIGDTLAPVPMNVFSNEKALHLYVDGKDIGKQQVSDGMATWDLRLPAGKHTVLVDRALSTPEKNIEVEILPFKLPGKGLDLAVNIGANYTFIDERTGQQWIEEQEYKPGSWGVTGGERLYVANKIGTKEDILNINYEDALYQTMRVNPEGFKADVPDGVYEVELMMVDYVPGSRRFVNDEVVNFNPGKRIFTIEANKKPVASNLDLGADYGQNVPVKLAFKCSAVNGEGINIRFIPVKGKPVLSAIRIRYSDY